MTFKRVHYRAEWDSGLTQSGKEDFVDTFFGTCDGSGLDGLIVGGEGGPTFILEGKDADIDSAVSDLDAANELVNGGVYFVETTGPVFSELTSHMKQDHRDIS